MKLAIMQPYFFPYLGYFDLLNSVDLFVVYDTVQFIKQGWLGRNRILHPSRTGWQYIYVPLNRASFHSSYRTPILHIRVASDRPWKQHILGQLAHYRKYAPYAAEAIAFVDSCLATEESSISRLNTAILKRCAELLGIDFRYQFCSDLDVVLDPTRSAEERSLICASAWERTNM